MDEKSGSSDKQPPAEGSPRLLAQVSEAIRRRYYSRRTEQAYVHWIRRFIYFHGRRHLRDMGEAEVTAFLNDLALTRKVAGGTQNQALSALLFLYKEVLGQDLPGSTGCCGRNARRDCLRFSLGPRRSACSRSSPARAG